MPIVGTIAWRSIIQSTLIVTTSFLAAQASVPLYPFEVFLFSPQASLTVQVFKSRSTTSTTSAIIYVTVSPELFFGFLAGFFSLITFSLVFPSLEVAARPHSYDTGHKSHERKKHQPYRVSPYNE